MPDKMRRREFLKGSASATAAWLALPAAAGAASEDAKGGKNAGDGAYRTA